MNGSNPISARPLPSAPDIAAQQLGIRERAFDAAQRLVLSQPHLVIGQLDQARLADWIMELAERFERWMLAANQPISVGAAGQTEAEGAASSSAAPEGCMSGWDDDIDAYIAKDYAEIALLKQIDSIQARQVHPQ